ncbi:MAG: MGMT family protein [Myxococcaceae bacterium]|nr:MGMT family protein [Myxococcaceae bacterium]MCA3011894.1 MGMT family protein [Myxococcaceae bacterium]
MCSSRGSKPRCGGSTTSSTPSRRPWRPSAAATSRPSPRWAKAARRRGRGRVSGESWRAKVRGAVARIPLGQTASYAQVALMAGRPGAARAVVRALDEAMSWWRVIRSDGTLAAEMVARQAPLLKREGVTLSGRRVPPAHRWTPGAPAPAGTTTPLATPSRAAPRGRSRSAPPTTPPAPGGSRAPARRPR